MTRFLLGALIALTILGLGVVMYSHREERIEIGPELPE